ncbi:sugar phosphate isomerase/epimerase [Leucothrix sargassi]|nr:sugar phosphate isomerase/epimerase [Leucothrix sargassi]
MKLDLYRTLWGVEAPLGSIAESLKQIGFSGVEARVPTDDALLKQFANELQANELKYIAILFSGGDVIPSQSETPQQHIDRLDQMFDAAATLSPEFINVLAGNDRWSMSQQVDFFGKVQEVADERGVVCSYETHRGTSLYSPWLTLELIEQLPNLRFTTDISHWVLVSERLLNDPLDDFSPFIERVHHTQARVGYEQGPQVPHPAAPEYAKALAFHQSVWESVWLQHYNEGRQTTTMTTEFGVDGYLHHLPFTNMPVADLWSLNDWMAIEEQAHFSRFTDTLNTAV